VLVAVLIGVFDPPPASLSVPWAYLALVASVTLASVVGAGVATVRMARRSSVNILRP
jgi:putative ABC transport system permease protein